MKTISAMQNQDGTYAFTISSKSIKSRMSGKSEIKEITESIMEISRAEITITVYPNDIKDGEMLKLEVKDNE